MYSDGIALHTVWNRVPSTGDVNIVTDTPQSRAHAATSPTHQCSGLYTTRRFQSASKLKGKQNTKSAEQKSVTVIRKMRETDMSSCKAAMSICKAAMSSCKALNSILKGAVTQITDFLGHYGRFESDCVSLSCRKHICVLHWKCIPMFVMILSKSRTSGLYCTTLCTYKAMP